MPRPPPNEPEMQVAIRIPVEWVKSAEKLARERSLPELKLSRTGVLRVALGRGLQDLVDGQSRFLKAKARK